MLTINWCAVDRGNRHWILTNGKTPATSNITWQEILEGAKISKREIFVLIMLVVSAIKKPDTIFKSSIVNQTSGDQGPKKGAEHPRHVDLTDHFVKVFWKRVVFSFGIWSSQTLAGPFFHPVSYCLLDALRHGSAHHLAYDKTTTTTNIIINPTTSTTTIIIIIIIIEKNGSKFSHLLTVRADGLTPPPP